MPGSCASRRSPPRGPGVTPETSACPTTVGTTGDGLVSHEHDDPEQGLRGRMPTFSTHQPISVHLELGGVGIIRLVASERSDTAVEVRPTNPASTADVAAAERTRVDCSDGRLTLNAPKGWRYYSGWGGWRESIDVEI